MAFKEQITTVENGLLVRAPAKINLSLLIAGKRPDGFHEIETLMAKVDLFDEILIQPGDKQGIQLICNGPHWAPDGKDNLVYQACDMLLENCKKTANIKITLTKNIPAGSGLGSASSDAAATLIGLNRFLDLGFSNEQLFPFAAQLGSDVSFFLYRPLALCTGKGEKIKNLDKKFDFLALLLLPEINTSTKKVYANYKHDKNHYMALKEQINTFLEKNRIDLICHMCANMLGTSCFDLCREIAVLKANVESLNVGPCCLSGSGSGMFIIVEDGDRKKAVEYQYKIQKKCRCKSVIVRNNRW